MSTPKPKPPVPRLSLTLVMAWKVLRCTMAESLQIARGFARHRLTRAECEGLILDWRDEGWAQ